MNYIEKWAARDEMGPYRDSIIIGDKEPEFNNGRWSWAPNQQIWLVQLNSVNVSLVRGEKTEVNLFVQPKAE